MSDDSVDKVDYYESFEIYKNATNRIIEKVKANRSFSFDDTPVDPRKLVAGHNIKDLKADGYTPQVKRLDFGVEQRKIKTKEERIHERYLIWCDSWVKEMNDLLEVEVEHNIEDIREWLRESSSVRSKAEKERVEVGFSEPHYLDSDLEQKLLSLKQILVPLLEEEERKRREMIRKRAEEARLEYEEKRKKNWKCILALHNILVSYYYYHYEALGSEKLIYISTNMKSIKHRKKGNPEARVILNSLMQDFLGKMGGRANFEVLKVHHILDEMEQTARFNKIAMEHLDHLYEEMDKVRGRYPRSCHLRVLRKMYNPKMFLNGIDDLRTTLKEMKDHGATKEEQEGRDSGEEKSS